jgi:hypothetical protein
MSTHQDIFAILLACAAILIAGCSRNSGPERIVVSGDVTYNGKPVADGMVYFVPPTTSSLPASGAAILDGKYNADGNGGVPVGTHKVRIEAYRYLAPAAAPGAAAPPTVSKNAPRQQYLPAKYNVDTTLEISVESGSRRITKDFQLTDRG